MTAGQAIEAAGGDVIAQLALRDFLERGELERHLRRMRARYGTRGIRLERAVDLLSAAVRRA
jgi:DNA-binding transcriptional MocR family regulator